MARIRGLENYHIESFRENGFIALQSVISGNELELYRDIYDRLFEKKDVKGFHLNGEMNADGTCLPQILEPSRYAPELNGTEFYHNARGFAQNLLGVEVEAKYGEHMIYKPAVRGAVTPWHQDQRHQNPRLRYRNVNVWLTLDDVTVDSGCMRYVPGSHLEDCIYEEPNSHVAFSAACPLPAGGCTLHAAYTLHSSGPNTSSRPRRVYILIFRAKPTFRKTTVQVR